MSTWAPSAIHKHCTNEHDRTVAISQNSLPIPDNLSVRLAGGQTPRDGRVEVYLDGVWGAVCGGSTWNMNASHVVCRQLGYEQAVESHVGRFVPNAEEVNSWLITDTNITE